MECVTDRGVNSGFHARLLIHPCSVVFQKGSSDMNDQKWAWSAVETRAFPSAKTPLISPTARFGEADAK